jgi:PTS system glucitol/sorbitol-specific IIA component
MTSGGPPVPPPPGGGTGSEQLLYETEVVAVGDLVPQFVEQGVLVLFGEQAPEELHEFSVLHQPTTAVGGPSAGDVIVVGDRRLDILAVGDVVADNLLNLGHLDIKADGRTDPQMPGDVCVPVGTLPSVTKGQRIRSLRVPAAGAASEGDPA